MKHNLTLIRRIMSEVEQGRDPENAARPDGKDSGTIAAHVREMIRHELIACEDDARHTLRGLTDEGRRFLQAVRDEKVVGKIRRNAEILGEKMTFEVVVAIVKDAVLEL